MYYRDCGACFEVGGQGEDSTGAIARRHAGYYLVI